MSRSRKQKKDSRDTSMMTVLNRLKSLEDEVARLKYNLRKTNNELYKLKDSLVYRNMATRITMQPDRVRTSVQHKQTLLPYLKRTGRAGKSKEGKIYPLENSRINKVKKSLHPVAHGQTKGHRNKKYTKLTDEVKEMHNRLVKAQEYRRNPHLKKKPKNSDGKTLRHSNGRSYSSVGSKTNIGSLGRSTVVNTALPMHEVLEQNPTWYANRAATMSQQSGSSMASHM